MWWAKSLISTNCRGKISYYGIIIKLVMDMNLGNRISELRMAKKLSQEELAKKVFVSNKTISSWELNRTEPDLLKV